MTMNAEGWAEIITRHAPMGTRYRFRIDHDVLVPDPASRFQPDDVHGPSEVIDPSLPRVARRPMDGRPGGAPRLL